MEFPNRPKPRWRYIIVFIIIILAISHTAVNWYFGEKDPIVNILDNGIEIKSKYGLKVDFYDITDLSLIEKTMLDIGIGTRVGGYYGFGGALKGAFQSNHLGTVLLFVQYKSSPTILIERFGKKDIYINFKDSKKTGALYNELKTAIKR